MSSKFRLEPGPNSELPMMARHTRVAIRFLDWLAEKLLAPDSVPVRQRTRRRGEEDAYFHVRKLGYIMVARYFRSPGRRGEID